MWMLTILPLGNNYCLLMVAVIRASVPRLNLDATFEQKNEIAKAVEDELEKVMIMTTKRPYIFCISCILHH